MKEFKIFVVKDELAGSYLQPTFIESKAEALRIFQHQINNIPLWKDNASDFSLYYIGIYDAETGHVIGAPELEKIASGHSVLRKETESDIQRTTQTSEN